MLGEKVKVPRIVLETVNERIIRNNLHDSMKLCDLWLWKRWWKKNLIIMPRSEIKRDEFKLKIL